MPRPSRTRRVLRRIWIVVITVHVFAILFSQFWEIRYVADTHWNGPMFSLDEGAIHYVNWGQPPPGVGDRWTQAGDDKGLSIQRNRYSDELAQMVNDHWLKPDSSPQFVRTFGHPAVGHRFKLSLLTLPLIAMGYFLFKRPRPYPPGQCAECGYDLTGNTSGVCSECGERIKAGEEMGESRK